MYEADNAWQQVTIGNLSADTDQEGNPGLNLMPIRTPFHPDVRYDQRKLFSLLDAQANALIDKRAVALTSAKGLPQQIGGIQDIIEQPYFSVVDISFKKKSEKIILQCLRDQLDKFDLGLRIEPNVFFFDLLPPDISLHHQWRHVDPCRFGACDREPRQCAFGPRMRSDSVGNAIMHRICYLNNGSNERTITARARVSMSLATVRRPGRATPVVTKDDVLPNVSKGSYMRAISYSTL